MACWGTVRPSYGPIGGIALSNKDGCFVRHLGAAQGLGLSPWEVGLGNGASCYCKMPLKEGF